MLLRLRGAGVLSDLRDAEPRDAELRDAELRDVELRDAAAPLDLARLPVPPRVVLVLALVRRRLSVGLSVVVFFLVIAQMFLCTQAL